MILKIIIKIRVTQATATKYLKTINKANSSIQVIRANHHLKNNKMITKIKNNLIFNKTKCKNKIIKICKICKINKIFSKTC